MTHHPVRNVFNLIADLLTLLAIAVAGVGHVLPWTNVRYIPNRNFHDFREAGPNGNNADREKRMMAAREAEEKQRRARQEQLTEFQMWHAMRSGIALGVLAFLVGLSLAVNWTWTARRWLSLLMFACAVTALLFEVMMHSPYQITDGHRELVGTFNEDTGFIMSVVATGCALFFCLARMVWTMPRTKPKVVPVLKAVGPNEDELGDYPEPKDYYAKNDAGGGGDKDHKEDA